MPNVKTATPTDLLVDLAQYTLTFSSVDLHSRKYSVVIKRGTNNVIASGEMQPEQTSKGGLIHLFKIPLLQEGYSEGKYSLTLIGVKRDDTETNSDAAQVKFDLDQAAALALNVRLIMNRILELEAQMRADEEKTGAKGKKFPFLHKHIQKLSAQPVLELKDLVTAIKKPLTAAKKHLGGDKDIRATEYRKLHTAVLEAEKLVKKQEEETRGTKQTFAFGKFSKHLVWGFIWAFLLSIIILLAAMALVGALIMSYISVEKTTQAGLNNQLKVLFPQGIEQKVNTGVINPVSHPSKNGSKPFTTRTVIVPPAGMENSTKWVDNVNPGEMVTYIPRGGFHFRMLFDPELLTKLSYQEDNREISSCNCNCSKVLLLLKKDVPTEQPVTFYIQHY